MKKLKQYIKEEIQKLSERKYDAPSEILDVLKNRLKINPLVRYIDYLKAVNSIPPSYRVFLHNGEFFDIIREDFSLMAKVGSKEYYLNDIDEKNYAIKHINRLLTGPKMRPKKSEEDEEDFDSPSPSKPKSSPPPPPPPIPTPEPEDEA
tara:strand:- start:138 stop:584 length:447 start_codon:yes stop_codon:yes gene_type:complete